MANLIMERFFAIIQPDGTLSAWYGTNNCVTLEISKEDRGPLDFSNIIGVVIQLENVLYQIGTTHGVIKGWFAKSTLSIAHSNAMTIEKVKKNVT